MTGARGFGRWLWLLLAVVAVVWFSNLEYRKLIRPDDGRYAEIPREMVVSGDWVTPRLNGFKYFEKPPLQYWATATAFEVLGLRDWVSRLWPALTGFAGLVLVLALGPRLLGDARTGAYAAAVLAGSPLYVGLGQFDTLDMGVSFFMAPPEKDRSTRRAAADRHATPRHRRNGRRWWRCLPGARSAQTAG